MGSPNFPLGVNQNPLTQSLFAEEFQNAHPPENLVLLDEAGVPLKTETGTNLLIE